MVIQVQELWIQRAPPGLGSGWGRDGRRTFLGEAGGVPGAIREGLVKTCLETFNAGGEGWWCLKLSETSKNNRVIDIKWKSVPMTLTLYKLHKMKPFVSKWDVIWDT